MKSLAFACLTLLISAPALAQTPDNALATPTGHELGAGIGDYTYREPGGAQSISIHGVKFVAAYTGTASLNRRHHWFFQADVRSTMGDVAYDGWCSPFLISPNSASPNGYELDIGNASPCSESGDEDWYVEGRAIVGKDLIGQRWALSPFSGVGLRHLSNGTTGTPGYRIDNYLYVPLGVTARTKVTSRKTASVTVEYDRLIHGWQTTHDAALGGGTIPATSIAPQFIFDGFTDISFAQSGGWALRASASYPLNARWSLEPYYVRWSVNSSPVNYETATFTVNGVTAMEQLGAYEPFNTTNEFGVRLGLHF